MFVGIDVSKEWVDVAVRPTGEAWRVTRDQDAVDGLVLRLKDLAPQLVVVEATGGYEVPSSSRHSARLKALPWAQYSQITIEERCEMARLRAAGHSIRQVAASLDRSPSTVSRELKRRFTYPGLPSGLCGSAGARPALARVPVGAGCGPPRPFSLASNRVGPRNRLSAGWPWSRARRSSHTRPSIVSSTPSSPVEEGLLLASLPAASQVETGVAGTQGRQSGVVYPSAPTAGGTSKGGL